MSDCRRKVSGRSFSGVSFSIATAERIARVRRVGRWVRRGNGVGFKEERNWGFRVLGGERMGSEMDVACIWKNVEREREGEAERRERNFGGEYL